MHRLHGLPLTVLIAMVAVSCQGDFAPDNNRLLQAFRNGDIGVWVTAQGPVTQILGDENQSGRSVQRFNVEINSELRILLVYHVGETGRIPAQVGDNLTFRGRYEFNASGGTVFVGRPGGKDALTGWIDHRGKRYE